MYVFENATTVAEGGEGSRERGKRNGETGDVLMYPNPAVDVLNVRGKLDSGAELILYNQIGSEVLRETVANNSSINVKELPSGCYAAIVTGDTVRP